MGHIIIFETKFVKLSDGRFLHFKRSGCNNDSNGRSRWDFGVELCTFEDVVTEINHWKTNYKPYKECNSMDLKIGSRCATMYDYGEHLLRMVKRAIPYEQFIKDFMFCVKLLTGFYVVTPEAPKETFYTVEAFEELNKLHRADVRYRRVTENVDVKNENEIIKLIEAHKIMDFYIEKR
jgi:hypothetical protein